MSDKPASPARGRKKTAPPAQQPPQEEVVVRLPLADLYPFPDHPFQVRDDEEMRETIQSVKEYGVSCPLITSSFSCTIFSDMVCCLLSEWCVVTSFYQRAANHVFFCPLFNFAKLILPYPASSSTLISACGVIDPFGGTAPIVIVHDTAFFAQAET